jgi:cell fate regulator YaaT (PSP1 superfamily)
MGCANCSDGGCSSGTPKGCKNNGHCGSGGCNKLEVFDWLAGIEYGSMMPKCDLVEVRFKNTRKEFYKVPSELEVYVGDAVVTESAFGYDIGMVSLTGELVKVQMGKKGISVESRDTKKLIRKATEQDLETAKKARAKEQDFIVTGRGICSELKIDMKLSDVEIQGDGSKAIFYYTADDRIDFRELIKMYAAQFKMRIEMKQIGSRQEAGRIGGIGSCGRELCCSTWLTDFRTVPTGAARYQQLSINPIKLAGQCGKLKCCLNYELDVYLDALKDFPSADVKLKTNKGVAFHQKTDIFKGLMWYAYAGDEGNMFPLEKERVKQIQLDLKSGKNIDDLKDFATKDNTKVEADFDYGNLDNQDSLTRFDNSNPNRKKKKRKKFKNKPSQN